MTVVEDEDDRAAAKTIMAEVGTDQKEFQVRKSSFIFFKLIFNKMCVKNTVLMNFHVVQKEIFFGALEATGNAVEISAFLMQSQVLKNKKL